MQNDTNKRKKIAPMICAGVMIALLGAILAVILFPLMGEVYGQWIAVGFLLIYCLVIAATIVGIVFALRQRLKEIESGEEEDAKQY